MDAPALRLHPSLDPSRFAAAYQRDGVVRIAPFLDPEAAERLTAALERATPWSLVHSNEAGAEEVLDVAALSALGREAVGQRLQALQRRATTGFAYVYLVYPMINAYLAGREPGHPLHALTEFLNSPEFLDFGRAVTGEASVIKTDAQASLYRPGDFLGLHDDTGVGERRAAYTIGFTRAWRADWGGQLLFHDEAGDVTRGFAPGFNVLTLFKAPQLHSVAPVAAYAGAPRLSIAGWLRDDPKA